MDCGPPWYSEFMLARFALQLLAIMIILLGLVIFPLPIPLGLILIAIGLCLLTLSSSRFRQLVKHLRKKNRKLHQAMKTAEQKSPHQFQKAIQQTDPDLEDSDSTEFPKQAPRAETP